jgi:UDP-N-acetylmuramoyl-L-alanyl-D-glutamate--2,6-diaminopimelate ligase
MKTLADILTAVTGHCEAQGRTDLSVHAIRYDSRQVKQGDLFVAVNGRDDRGVEFTGAAIEAGAGIVVTDAPDRMPRERIEDKDVTLVVVDDARAAMAEMSGFLWDYPGRRLKIYGVTGTNGKTTATYLLKQLLEACGEQCGMIGTLGKMLGTVTPTGYTTPEAPELEEIFDEMVRGGCTAVTMEVSSHALVLERVAGVAFGGALFTNLTQDHLDFHLTMQDYHDAKKLLFDRLDAGRPAVVNIDDLHGESMVRDSHAGIYRYGSGGAGSTGAIDARIGGVGLAADGSRWSLTFSERLGGGTAELRSRLVGAFNIANVTGALALALALGYDRETLLRAVPALEPVPGRMESIALGDGAAAVVDYAHTPDALENVLKSLRDLRAAGGRITAVFGCGGDRDRAKRPLMGEIAARLADRVVLTSDNPRSEEPERIIDEIASGMPQSSGAERIADRRAAIEHALDGAAPGDLVLIAGKGHEDYQIIGAERRHFNDCEVVREWIARRSVNHAEGMATA